MLRISDFYLNKSKAERKLKALEDLITCEKILKADSISIVGGGCISTARIGSVSSDIVLAPNLSHNLYQAIMDAIEEHIRGLKEINKRIDNEREEL